MKQERGKNKRKKERCHWWKESCGQPLVQNHHTPRNKIDSTVLGNAQQRENAAPNKLEETIDAATSALGCGKFEHAKWQWNLLKVTLFKMEIVTQNRPLVARSEAACTNSRCIPCCAVLADMSFGELLQLADLTKALSLVHSVVPCIATPWVQVGDANHFNYTTNSSKRSMTGTRLVLEC